MDTLELIKHRISANKFNTTRSLNEDEIKDIVFYMIAAAAKGLASGPMIGFDPEGVKREFNIADRYVPAMLVTVGYPAAGNSPRKPRLAVDEVLAFKNGSKFEW